MFVTAIVAAAGQGKRFGAGANKVFTPLLGEPILAHTLRSVERCAAIDAVVIVTGAEDVERCRATAAEVGCGKLLTVCEGGAERYESVWNALQAVPAHSDLVAVHDGARPLCRPALMERVIRAAAETGAALPALRISDTVKRSENGASTTETVDRAQLYGVQTPQVFSRDLLLQAYRAARDSSRPGTDDASFVEALGHSVTLVPGDRDNLKITLPEDLEMAERLLGGAETRTGYGYDVHPLIEGRALFLGGVEIPHTHGLEGHSDADVLLHALCDALLGAAGLGDIGLHFPNTDPQYRNISSLKLLAAVARELRAAGWTPVNVDAMLLAEAPKIRPHADAMRARIAETLGIAADRVNIKATTGEGLGFVGRREGVAAQAVTTLRRL